MADDFIYRAGRRDKTIETQSHRVECKAYCPNCGYGPMDCCAYMDVAEPGEHTKETIVPKPGTYTLCISCGEYLAYEGTPLTLRIATKQEVEEIVENSDPDQLRVYTLFQDKIKEQYRRANT